MEFRSISVEMTQELFERSIKGLPKEAIKELIWNACDADAKNIEVSFDYEGINGVEDVSDIYVKDDGHGIPFEMAEEYFGKYGSSQKTYSEKSPSGRIFHGKLGQGRYKSLAAGNFVEWETVFREKNGSCRTYKMQISAGSRRDVRISEEAERTETEHTGTKVHIHGVLDERIKAVNRLTENEDMIPDLLATFAPYLLAYSDISLKYNGVVISPTKQIEKKLKGNCAFKKKALPSRQGQL